MKEELKKKLEEVSDEGTMNEEEYKVLQEKVRKFLFSLMVGGEYTEEKMDEVIQEVSKREEKPYTDYPDSELYELVEISVKGYSGFGKEFISRIISADPELSTKLYEVTIQQLIELNHAVEAYQASLSERLNELKKEEQNHNESVKGE